MNDTPKKVIVLSPEETRRLFEEGRQLALKAEPELRRAVKPDPNAFDFRVRGKKRRS